MEAEAKARRLDLEVRRLEVEKHRDFEWERSRLGANSTHKGGEGEENSVERQMVRSLQLIPDFDEQNVAARGCVEVCPRSQDGFALAKTLDSIEKSRAAKLAGSRDQYRALCRRTRTLLRKEYVRSLAEDGPWC